MAMNNSIHEITVEKKVTKEFVYFPPGPIVGVQKKLLQLFSQKNSREHFIIVTTRIGTGPLERNRSTQ